MIDEDQQEIRELAQEVGLKLVRVLKGGFGYVRPAPDGRVRAVQRNAARGWERLSQQLAPLARRYRLGEGREGTAVARENARDFAAQWAAGGGGERVVRAAPSGRDGGFLADP